MKESKEPRVILGLDVSTACIGISIVEDYGDGSLPKIIAITHKAPKVPKDVKGLESMFLKKEIFKDGFLMNIGEYTNKKITDVVIEEPLLSSNNVNTVGILLRFNTLIAEAVFEALSIVPNFISSYDARMYSFPELVSIRKYNKKGNEYPLKHVKDAIKKNNIVMFGSYPFDVDKKSVIMNMVNSVYDIPWEYNKNGELRKENYDACDALVCNLAYVNINNYGLSKPEIINSKEEETDAELIISYTTKIWDKTFDKRLILTKKLTK